MNDSMPIQSLLEQKKHELMEALPKSIGVDRFVRVAVTTILRSPELARCTPASLYGCLLQSAQLGLEIGLMNQAHLVPYWNKDKRCWEAQFQIGYLGLRDLAERYGDVVDTDVGIVREKDTFSYALGACPSIVHTPSHDQDRGAATHYYAWAKPRNGSMKLAVMTRTEVEAYRDQYVRRMAEGKFPPSWRDSFDAMALKTVMRRLYKYLARSPQLREAIALDELSDIGAPQHLGVEVEREQIHEARVSNDAQLAHLRAQGTLSIAAPESNPPADQAPASDSEATPAPVADTSHRETPISADRLAASRARISLLVKELCSTKPGLSLYKGLHMPSQIPDEHVLFWERQLERLTGNSSNSS